ncbi:hypothetical protein ATANTOWER_000006 [Ataeniobius toweri]|uniref:Uncharacterized protein n=1 Tax=Ataeniobius toweri TaxID=208326 RepID=A0ABU7CDC3_9TELE|nr:hypothetical protein [Ataeniobius toweri]
MSSESEQQRKKTSLNMQLLCLWCHHLTCEDNQLLSQAVGPAAMDLHDTVHGSEQLGLTGTADGSYPEVTYIQFHAKVFIPHLYSAPLSQNFVEPPLAAGLLGFISTSFKHLQTEGSAHSSL